MDGKLEIFVDESALLKIFRNSLALLFSFFMNQRLPVAKGDLIPDAVFCEAPGVRFLTVVLGDPISHSSCGIDRDIVAGGSLLPVKHLSTFLRVTLFLT